MFAKINNGALKTHLKRDCFDILSEKTFYAGDVLILDLDETLLFCRQGNPLPAHPKLRSLLNTLRNQAVICIGLTARTANLMETTQQQLSDLGFSFDLAENLFADMSFEAADFDFGHGVFYSPSETLGDKKISTKGKTAKALLQALFSLDEQRLKQIGLNKPILARQIVVLDDSALNLRAIEDELRGLYAITSYLVERKPLFVSNTQDPTLFPDDLSSLRFIEHIAGGSGGVYKLQDDRGYFFTFKAHQDIHHLLEECAADALCQALGGRVPGFAVFSGEIPTCLAEEKQVSQNGIFRLAQFIQADMKATQSLFKDKLCEHFLVDALLANRDTASRDNEGNFRNIILDGNNILYRIDNGGALRFKSTEGLKTQDLNWSIYHVEELHSLRDQSVNPDAALIYGDLNEPELQRQYQEILKHKDSLFKTLQQLAVALPIYHIEKLEDFIVARLDDLKIRFEPNNDPHTPALKNIHAHEKYNSASILSTATYNGVSYVLFGQRIRHEWYSNLGGMSESSDGYLSYTASREAREESGGLIHVPPGLLDECPSHDLITKNAEGRPHTHRMFFVDQGFVPVQNILEAVKVHTSFTQEHSNFVWVPIQSLLNAINNDSTIVVEGVATMAVENIALFPPFAMMLKQAPVIEHLQRRVDKLPLILKRSRSIAEEKNPYVTTDLLDHPSDQSALGEYKTEHTSEPEELRNALINKMLLTSRLHQEFKAQKKINKNTAQSAHKMQSIAHLESITGSYGASAEQLIDDFVSREVADMKNGIEIPIPADAVLKTKFLDIVSSEAEFPGRIALYHATNSKMGFLSDFISTIRSLLLLEDIRSLRAFDTLFAGIADVEAFLLEQCQQQAVKKEELNNFVKDFQEKCLSCNVSLFANSDQHSLASSSIFFMLSNKSCSNNDLTNLSNAMSDVLHRLEIRSVSVEDFIDLYEEHQKELSAHLYQFFIKDEWVDSLCYPSFSFGRYYMGQGAKETEMKSEGRQKLLPLIKNLGNDAYPDLQVRFYLQPEYLHNSQFVTIKTHKIQENPAELQTKLYALCQCIVRELLQKKQALKTYYQGSCPGQAALLPLQRLYAMVNRGQYNRDIMFERMDYMGTLHRHIQSGQLLAFEKLLESLPADIDLHQATTDISGKKRNSLLHAAIETKQINMLGVLLKSRHCMSTSLMQVNCDLEIPLFFAINKGDAAAVDLILQSEHAKARVFNQTDWLGDTILMCAVVKGSIEVVRLILNSQYCDAKFFRHVNKLNDNAVTRATTGGQTAVLELLLKNEHFKPELFMNLSWGDTALSWAVIGNHVGVVELIFKSDHCTAEVFTQSTEMGGTALLTAVSKNNLTMVNLVLQHRHCTMEYLMQPDLFGNTALSWWDTEEAIIKVIENKIAALKTRGQYAEMTFFAPESEIPSVKYLPGASPAGLTG